MAQNIIILECLKKLDFHFSTHVFIPILLRHKVFATVGAYELPDPFMAPEMVVEAAPALKFDGAFRQWTFG